MDLYPFLDTRSWSAVLVSREFVSIFNYTLGGLCSGRGGGAEFFAGARGVVFRGGWGVKGAKRGLGRKKVLLAGAVGAFLGVKRGVRLSQLVAGQWVVFAWRGENFFGANRLTLGGKMSLFITLSPTFRGAQPSGRRIRGGAVPKGGSVRRGREGEDGGG
jgi:hypothetical protein